MSVKLIPPEILAYYPQKSNAANPGFRVGQVWVCLDPIGIQEYQIVRAQRARKNQRLIETFTIVVLTPDGTMKLQDFTWAKLQVLFRGGFLMADLCCPERVPWGPLE